MFKKSLTNLMLAAAVVTWQVRFVPNAHPRTPNTYWRTFTASDDAELKKLLGNMPKGIWECKTILSSDPGMCEVVKGSVVIEPVETQVATAASK